MLKKFGWGDGLYGSVPLLEEDPFRQIDFKRISLQEVDEWAGFS